MNHLPTLKKSLQTNPVPHRPLRDVRLLGNTSGQTGTYRGRTQTGGIPKVTEKDSPPDRTPCPHRGIGPVSRLLQGTAHDELQSRSQQELVQFSGGKEGLLTKILLYGKPTVRVTAYYGNSMRGFIREGNPSTGPKYGAWKLSRDDILDQLAAQSLTENDSGWITINMLGEIPQEIGKLIFWYARR